MKTANLFVDHILVGAVWTLMFILVRYLFFPPLPDLDISSTSVNDGFLIAASAVVVYVIGVFFDQFSDRILKLLERPLKMEKISEGKKSFKASVEMTYHEALQATVTRSQRAYEYLSYRRSVIRIIRSLFISSILTTPVVWIIAIIRMIQCDWPTQIYASTTTALLLTAVVIFLRMEIIRAHSGYFDAIKNFYKSLHKV